MSIAPREPHAVRDAPALRDQPAGGQQRAGPGDRQFAVQAPVFHGVREGFDGEVRPFAIDQPADEQDTSPARRPASRRRFRSPMGTPRGLTTIRANRSIPIPRQPPAGLLAVGDEPHAGRGGKDPLDV